MFTELNTRGLLTPGTALGIEIQAVGSFRRNQIPEPRNSTRLGLRGSQARGEGLYNKAEDQGAQKMG